MTSLVIGAAAVQRRLRDLERHAVAQALPQALNRTAQQARTVALRAVARALGLRQRTLRRSFRIARASRAKPQAALIAAGWPLPLMRFRPRQTWRGVTVSIGGRRQLQVSAFIATMPRNRHTSVFRRKGRPRLPIKKLYGPSVPATLAQAEILRAVQASIRDRLPKNLASDLRYYRARAAGRL